MTNKRYNRRQRSQLSSAWSEENSPAAKKLTSTKSEARRLGVPSRSANIPTTSGHLQEEPSRGEIWKILTSFFKVFDKFVTRLLIYRAKMYAFLVPPKEAFLKTIEHPWTKTILSRGGWRKLFNPGLMNKLIRME